MDNFPLSLELSKVFCFVIISEPLTLISMKTLKLMKNCLGTMMRRPNLPRFYDWGGGGLPILWSFGWETGKDNDLICVKPKVETALDGEFALSPVCRSRAMAIFAFIIKSILIRIDDNITYMLKYAKNS